MGDRFDELRRQAESLLVAGPPGSSAKLPEDLAALIHELRVHEIELQLQNEELRRVQEELTATRDRYFDLYDRAPVGYLTLDTRGMISEVNLTGALLLGVKRRLLEGQVFSRFVAREHSDRLRAQQEKASRGDPASPVEIELRRGDGSRIWARVDCSVDRDSGEKVASFRLAVSDVSEDRRRREEQDKLERRLAEALRFESLGVLAAGVAHDFNNILMVILGHVELALNDLPGDAPARAWLARVDQFVERGAQLNRQLLAYCGKAPFDIRPIGLSALVEDMASLLTASIEETVKLELRLAAGLPAVLADSTQICQVVVNLVKNAAEAIGDQGGQVTITTSVRDCDRAFLDDIRTVEDLAPGRYVCLEVQDNGRGMDKGTQQKMFEPFFSTKFTGRGLGLAALLGIVRGHQGALKVTSELGQGTSVMVLLPASQEEERPVAGQTEPARDGWRGSGIVLVVDDEPDVREFLKAFLERNGFEVLEAADGDEGVEVFRRRAGEIVLVLLDLKMPKMSGLDALREIRRIRSDACVIFMSGYSEQMADERLDGPPSAGFLQKPFRLAAIKQKLREVLTA